MFGEELRDGLGGMDEDTMSKARKKEEAEIELSSEQHSSSSCPSNAVEEETYDDDDGRKEGCITITNRNKVVSSTQFSKNVSIC